MSRVNLLFFKKNSKCYNIVTFCAALFLHSFRRPARACNTFTSFILRRSGAAVVVFRAYRRRARRGSAAGIGITGARIGAAGNRAGGGPGAARQRAGSPLHHTKK